MRSWHGWVARGDRQEVDVDTHVLRDSGESVSVKVTNLSPEGCRVQADDLFRIGEHVSIAFARAGNLRAQVRWALPGSAGTQFVDDCDTPEHSPQKD